MKNLLYCTLLLLLIYSCENYKNQSKKKIKYTWVYVEVETIINRDTTPSYIYGKMKNNVINNLDNLNGKNLFEIRDVRYFNDDDKLQLYKDEDESGVLYYRIGGIKKLSKYSRDPAYSFEKDELHESVLEIVKNRP